MKLKFTQKDISGLLLEFINILFAIAMLYIDNTTTVDNFFTYCFAGILVYNSITRIIQICVGKSFYPFLFLKFIRLRSSLLFIVVLITGAVPTILQLYYTGSTFHFHHIVNNILPIPFIIFFYKKHFNELEQENKFFSNYFNDPKKSESFEELSRVFITISVYYLLFFTLSNWNIESVKNIAKIWNCAYLMIVLYLYLVFIICTFIAINNSPTSIKGNKLFPAKAQLCMDIFYIIWMTMVFRGERIEMYYVICLIGNIALRILQVLWCQKKHDIDNVQFAKIKLFSIIISIILGIYGIVIMYINSKINYPQEPYSILLTILYLLIAAYVIIQIVWERRE